MTHCRFYQMCNQIFLYTRHGKPISNDQDQSYFYLWGNALQSLMDCLGQQTSNE